MIIEALALNNYRNYEEEDISFSKGINILYGDNAQGKTNILEAIYMLATTKSHRGSFDKEVISFGKEESHIKADIIKNEVSHRIDIHLRKNKNKGVAVDRVPISRSTQLFGLVNVILFAPEDLNIIKESPSERRRFIDMGMCRLSKVYYSNLLSYNKVLNQRNNLLKQIGFDNSKLDMLDVWDIQLTEYGIKIIKDRNNFINMLNEIIPDIHRNLTGNQEKLFISYDKNTDEEHFSDFLYQKRDIDLKYQSTQIGPHRDDISFFVNDMDVKRYGSQGQIRTVALSLKLAEIQLVKKMINDNPILLLDDVMSELDSRRRDSLLSSINNLQTIITCTGYDDFIKERINIDRIYKVINGKVHLEA